MRSSRALLLLTLLSASCFGKREAPELTDSNLSVGNGNGNGNGNGTTSNGGGNLGGNGGGGFGGIGGGLNVGGSGPVLFAECGCALETLDSNNANCQDCIQLATDRSGDACFLRYDDCLADPDCLDADQRLQTCGTTPTIDCATTALEGTPHDSGVRLVEYYDCVCTLCADACSPEGEGGAGGGAGGAGGTGGGSDQTGPCTITP